MGIYYGRKQMKSYNEIIGAIMNHKDHPITKYKFDLMAEYGEYNHIKCSEIMDILNNWDYSYELDSGLEPYEPPEVNEDKLKSLAQDIYNRGGLQTLRMNYYTMFHYHAEDMNTKHKVQQLQHIWNGVGEWRY